MTPIRILLMETNKAGQHIHNVLALSTDIEERENLQRALQHVINAVSEIKAIEKRTPKKS